MYIILYINYTSLKERESCQLVMAEHYEEYLRESWMKKVRLEKLKVSGSRPISAQIRLLHFAAFLLVTQPLNEFRWRQKTYFFSEWLIAAWVVLGSSSFFLAKINFPT